MKPTWWRKTSDRVGRGRSCGILPEIETIENLIGSEKQLAFVDSLYMNVFGEELPVRELSHDAATSSRLEKELNEKWRCIHFAGHGIFVDPANARLLAGHTPFRRGPSSDTSTRHSYFAQRNHLHLSGLMLAPAPGGDAWTGLLTAEDLSSYDLRGTDLVVPSACETGLGCSSGGDGVLGADSFLLDRGSAISRQQPRERRRHRDVTPNEYPILDHLRTHGQVGAVIGEIVPDTGKVECRGTVALCK